MCRHKGLSRTGNLTICSVQMSNRCDNTSAFEFIYWVSSDNTNNMEWEIEVIQNVLMIKCDFKELVECKALIYIMNTQMLCVDIL